jgi:hypothetical protein
MRATGARELALGLHGKRTVVETEREADEQPRVEIGIVDAGLTQHARQLASRRQQRGARRNVSRGGGGISRLAGGHQAVPSAASSSA